MLIHKTQREVTIKKLVPTLRIDNSEFNKLHEFYYIEMGKNRSITDTHIDAVKICGNAGELECELEVDVG